MHWGVRLLGILLGILLGLGIIALFVFVYSERTVDAPSISGHKTQAAPGGAEERNPGGVQTVHVVGGAPPPSGPPTFSYGRGRTVRLRVISDGAVELELLGYGIKRTVEPGKPAVIAVKTSRSGNFPLIVTASHIAVATIRVGSTP